jgi:hypothetical protein
VVCSNDGGGRKVVTAADAVNVGADVLDIISIELSPLLYQLMMLIGGRPAVIDH